jgi:hypothetical protein
LCLYLPRLPALFVTATATRSRAAGRDEGEAMRHIPRYRRYLPAAVMLATMSVVSVAGPASAAIGQPAPEQPEQHCVVALGPTSTGVPVASCYPTFAQAMRAARSVTRVGDRPLHQRSAPLTSVVIGIDYSSTGFAGSTLTWTEPVGCGSYSASSMPAGWNDVVESVRNFNGCGTTLYQNTAFGGSSSSVGVNGSASTLGSFNRQASSQRWCTSSSC